MSYKCLFLRLIILQHLHHSSSALVSVTLLLTKLRGSLSSILKSNIVSLFIDLFEGSGCVVVCSSISTLVSGRISITASLFSLRSFSFESLFSSLTFIFKSVIRGLLCLFSFSSDVFLDVSKSSGRVEKSSKLSNVLISSVVLAGNSGEFTNVSLIFLDKFFSTTIVLCFFLKHSGHT